MFETLLLLGFYYPTGSQFRGYLTIRQKCRRASGVTFYTLYYNQCQQRIHYDFYYKVILQWPQSSTRRS